MTELPSPIDHTTFVMVAVTVAEIPPAAAVAV